MLHLLGNATGILIFLRDWHLVEVSLSEEDDSSYVLAENIDLLLIIIEST
jgi:hypothetical protein